MENLKPQDQTVQPSQLMEFLLGLLNRPSDVATQEFADWLFESGYNMPPLLMTPEESLTSNPVLGPEARLSECPLWQMQEAYYANLGVSAWNEAVPNFITSSAFIAESYADAIVAFLQDYHDGIHPDEPIYIVEMATGVGRFSFLLLQELERKMAGFSKLQSLRLKYIMTDFTENNVNFWRTHEKLKPYVEKGMLDFARFRPEEEDSFQLLVSGKTVSQAVIHNPVIAIANYFFDTIRHDVFRIEQHILHEGLVTLERDMSRVPDPQGAIQFSEIKATYRHVPLPNEHYYDDADFNTILRQYRESFDQGAIIFPLGGLRVVRNLMTLSKRNLVLLSSDKAYTALEPMLQCAEHHFAAHGSFSYMVNYDAIGRYFTNMGGHYLHTTQRSTSLQTVCCLLTEKTGSFEWLQYHFNEKQRIPHPIVSVMEVTNYSTEEVSPADEITRLLSEFRLSLCDPRIFCAVARKLVPLAQHITADQKEDLYFLMNTCWEKSFFYRGEVNLPFWFGELLYNLGEFDASLLWWEQAMHGYHEYDYEYLYFKGRSYEALDMIQEAHAMYSESLALNPAFTLASEAIGNLERADTVSG